jgi:hypothetical protein
MSDALSVEARRRLAFLAAGLALFVALAASPARVALESRMPLHVLVQLPLLALAGWWWGKALPLDLLRWLGPWNRNGVTGLTLVVFTAIFWEMPRSLDGAVESAGLELAKFVSLPLGIGLPLALSWPHAPTLLRGFIQAHVLSMSGVLTWLYSVAPVRLCNNYLIDDQEILGIAFGAIALLLSAVWGGRLFLTPALSDGSFDIRPNEQRAHP